MAELKAFPGYDQLKYDGVDLLECLLMNIHLAIRSNTSDKQVKTLPLRRTLLEKVSEFYSSGRLKNNILKYATGNRFEKLVGKEKHSGKTVVFFPFDPAHLDYHLPVYQAMKRKGTPFMIYTTVGAVYTILKKKGFNPLFLYPQVSYEDARLYNGNVEQYFNTLPVPFRNEHHVYLDLFREYVTSFSVMLIPFINNIRIGFSKFSPASVVVGNDITLFGRTLVLLSKQQHVPSFCIMHGSITGEPLDSAHIADSFLVFGEKSRKELTRIGNDPKSLVITGTPFLDNYQKQSGVIDPLIRKTAGIGDDQKYILFAHSGPGHCTTHHHFEQVVTAVMRASQSFPQYRFIAKLHPKDRLEHYKLSTSEVIGNRLLLVEHNDPGYPGSFLKWLHGCDLLITGSSAAAQEAMLMEIPVITIDLMNEYTQVDFIDDQATIHITDAGKLNSAISQLLEDKSSFMQQKKNAREYVAQSYYQLDGNSAMRCAELISQTIN